MMTASFLALASYLALTENGEIALITGAFACITAFISAFFAYLNRRDIRNVAAQTGTRRRISTDAEEGVFIEPPTEDDIADAQTKP